MIEIIPAIDIIGGRCVRLSKGDYNAMTEYRERPDEMVRRFVDNGFKRIHVVDLDGAKAGHPENLRSLEAMASAADVHIEWGGGIKTDTDLHSALDAGATYVVAGSIAVKQPALFSRWLSELPETMILGADAREGRVAVSGWLDTTEVTIEQVFERFLPGLTQAIVTDIAKDGMLKGPNFRLYADLQERYPDVDITVSGGISSMADIERLDQMHLRRVIVGKALYEGHISLADLARYCF